MRKRVIYLLMILALESCQGNRIFQSYVVKLFSVPVNSGIPEKMGIYKSGTSVMVSANANIGYTIINWKDAEGRLLTSDNQNTFKVSHDEMLSSHFKIDDLGSGTPPSLDTLAPADTLISKQENFGMTIIPNYGTNGTNVPKGLLQVSIRYIGDLFMTNGISIDHSGAAVRGEETEMVINTKDLDDRGLYHSIQGGGPHIWVSKNFDRSIYPWSDTSNELVFQMKASVPVVNLTDSQENTAHFGFSADQAPVTQLSFGFYLHDDLSGQTFAYIICAYESRGSYKETAQANDTYTNFVSTPVENNSRYITMDPKSASLQSKPFSEKGFLKVHIDPANLLQAIHDAENTLPSDIKHLKLTMAAYCLSCLTM